MNLTENQNLHHTSDNKNLQELEQLKKEFEKLKQEKEALFECSSIGYVFINSALEITTINSAACSIFGFDPVVLKNSRIDLLVPTDSEAFFKNIIEEVFHSKSVKKADIAVNGLSLHIEASLIDDQNCLLTLINTHAFSTRGSQNTEKIHASIEAMKEIHRKSGNIISAISDCHILLDNEWNIKDINVNALKDSGLESKIEGKNFWKTFENIITEDIEKRFKTALKNNTPDNFEAKLKNGRQVEYQIYPVEGGLLVYYKATSEKEIYEEALHKSELIYRAMGESINYGIWICAPDGQNVYASDSFLELVGLTQEQCSSFGWGNVLHPDDAERTIEAWKKCVKEGGKWDIEHRYKGVDGKWHHVLARGVPVKDRDGNVFCWAGINLDIDQLKNTQLELQRSRERELQRANELEAILDALPAMVWISRDPNGSEIYGNRNANELLGVNKNQNATLALGSVNDIKVYHNNKLVELNALPIELAICGRKISNYELDLVYPDNSVVNLIGNSVPLYDMDGNITGAVAAFTNITSVKTAQKLLSESERKFSQLSNALPQMAWIANPDGFRTWYNDRWYDYTGSDFEQMQGWGWLKVQDQDKIDETLHFWKTHLNDDKPFETIHRLKRKDGVYRHFLTRVVPLIDKNGSVINWFGTNTDITELKQFEESLRESENKYRLLFEFMPLGLEIINEKGETIYGNEKYRQYLEGQQTQISACNLITRDGCRLKHEESLIARVLKEKKVISNFEFGIKRANNDIRWLNVSAAPMSGNKEFLIVYHDITEKREHEKELQKISDQLQKLNNTKDKLFVIIAHDLRNPFTSLMGFAEILINQQEAFTLEETKKYLNIIYDSAKQAYNLLENLLNWSRSQTGTLNIKPEILNVRTVMINNIKVAHHIALKKDIEISLHIEKELEFLADKNTIDAVIRNLLSNAIKFSYPGGKIKVSATSKNNMIEITIKDHGVGIDKKDLTKLFNIENKFTSLGTQKEKGSGLGLVICKEFIEKNHGSISIHSEKGKGSTLTLLLPKP